MGNLGKICSGLRVRLNDLTDLPREDFYYVSRDKLIPSKEVEGQYKVYSYFPYEKNRPFELYGFLIEPHSKYVSGGHGEDTAEYLWVNKGVLSLEAGGKKYIVKEGDAVRFDTHKDHTYGNDCDDILDVTVVFLFEK